ncbi:dynamin family protein [Haliscomenobacter sp.]|uniref:dynamin family protein n=1 Tax=Haliscomenobacter sp. TaxID=2717303 RepID=UPI0035931AE0
MKSKIQAVISNRGASIDAIKQTLEYINSALINLSDLKRFEDWLIEQEIVDDITKKELQNNDIEKFVERLSFEKKYWENIQIRFARQTLNIGVVGRMGQGKSTFLQSISALTDEHIPAKSGQACTSTQSVIYHTESKEFAKVYYYNEKDFINEVLYPYYSNLDNIKGLGKSNLPSSLSEFEKTSFKPLGDIQGLSSKKEGWYNNLLKLHSNIADYKNLISSDFEEINISKIKEFVQYTYNEKNDDIASYRYVAVKKIEIFTKFPDNNVFQLGLIDIPGLGDTRLGDEERMIRALGEDVDIILFIRKPDKDRNQWQDVDTNLYDIASSVLREKLSLDTWSFMLINNRHGSIEDCNLLKKTISLKGRIKTIDCLIANCKSPEESKQALETIITYLVTSISELDAVFIKNCRKLLYLTE